MTRPVWHWWSSGKDAAFALHRLLDDSTVHVTALVTTIDAETGCVPFQGTGRELLELQAAATGLPLHLIELPRSTRDDQYSSVVGELCRRARAEGVVAMSFGDIHLADVRAWRDAVFDEHGMATLYPLWGQDTATLARRMIAEGLRARVTCVDPHILEESRLGQEFDATFVDALPEGVDACGERGEFHTFVTAGPMLHDVLDVDVDLAGIRQERGFLVAEPVLRMPLDGTLDLHGIAPAEIGDLLDDYIDACRAAGVLSLRIVHGKGMGVQRERVHARLRRRADVASFSLGGEGAGGWGATVVRLHPVGPEKL